MANSRSILVVLCFMLLECGFASAMNVSYDGRGFILDGKRSIILSGSIHYPRSTPEMWPDLIKKAKEGGLNTVETYVFWNAHEPLYRQYDFTENKDLVRFIKTIQEEGLHAILRIGPYVCGEWNYGGFPVWLHNMPGIKLRTKNYVYQNEMKTFTTMIVDMMKAENLFASQGGPIIIAQIENEYGNVNGPYGNDGKEYIQWCAQLALSYRLQIPWIMCQEGDAPPTMINTCNGFYCDQFWPNNAKEKPKGWTENWSGWFKNWGMKDPYRTAEDLAFSVGRFFQYGGSFQNYYMYHGGTNFNRTAGGPYIATSYDYNAPLDEYGNLNQPKWGHLKRLHEIIMSIEAILTYGEQRNIDYDNLMSATIWSYKGKQSCFLGNAHSDKDLTVDLLGTNFTVPAWSVTILPDCATEVYNTAKVSSQTSIMVKEANGGEDRAEPYDLQWLWRPEHFEKLKNGNADGSIFTVNEMMDQKAVTNDTSDYLWYLTSVDIEEGDPIVNATNLNLQVHTEGHVLHAFFNGKHLATKHGYEMTLEEPVSLKPGTNTISLLSATVGLQNYGSNFDMSLVGINGPVNLIGYADGNEIIKNLTTNPWTYKVGIHGIEKGLFRPDSRYQSGWKAENLPSDRMFVWYKTTFKSPLGTDPVVVDLMGLGKGTAWVNGNNLGRYWPSYLADGNGCSATCDYRGAYDGNKCLTNCGKPSQRYYHVPRSWFKDDGNELVLFEEFGGTPMNTQFYTVTVGSMCAVPYEGQKLELSCQGGKLISEIRFASFGNPTGTCGKFMKGDCEAPNTMSVIKKECLGMDRCTLDVSENTFGPTGCKIVTNKLAVEAVCSVSYDFSANYDLVRFIKTIQAEGLYAILRIGPYACAEWNYGGFPVWLHNLPDVKLRTKNQVYQNEMKTFTTLIVNMMKEETLFASQGGPIIVAQIENEYGNIGWAYGNEGKEYIKWCADLALSYNLDVPWIMCQQGNAPSSMINTCNGYYCDQFWPNDADNKPKGFTENWTGWFKAWGNKDPHRTAEDLAFSVVRFFQFGGSFHNYYMYHGGTNFNKTSGGPYMTTSYDYYDAPLDEYGNLNQPKWGHLKQLHEIILSMEETLTYGDRRNLDYGNMMSGTIWSYKGKQSCMLGNANNYQEFTVDLMGTKFTVPAWSVTILPDCYFEAYNTAKVSVQRSKMVKLLNGDDKDNHEVTNGLKWLWRPEHFEQLRNGSVRGSVFTVNKLLDQKAVTNDTSDYLWYLTSVDVKPDDPILKTVVTLQIRTEGHVLHAFVNGRYISTRHGYGLTFEEYVKLRPGTNTISILSASVGLKNYGAHYDDDLVGVHGPVKLIGNKGSPMEVVKNLTGNPWTYKVGIQGIERGVFKETKPSKKWRANSVPSNRMFVWYKATFEAPLGTDPVVVDLIGLGKGTAWVNGNNIGRYWPTFLAGTDGCSNNCDYRGAYGSNKCLTNCGKPTQRYYHIPRSWLENSNNELVLFEEFGGSPMNIKFHTVTVGSMCATQYEGQKLELSCQGGWVITEIKFASFGAPMNSCRSFRKGPCEAPNTLTVVEKECLGKDSCTVEVSENTFGPTGCKMVANKLAVEAVCGKDQQE